MKQIINNFRGLAGAATISVALAISAAPAQAQVERLDISAVVGKDTFFSPSLSPDGRLVAAVLSKPDADTLILIDRETGAVTPIQRATSEDSLSITGVQFKNNNRILFSVQQKYEIKVDKASSARRTATVDPMSEGFGFVTRIYAVNTDGSNLLSLYDPSLDQALPRTISANIADILRKDPDHVLMLIPSYGGTELRKVDINTGKNETIDSGSQRTVGWVLDSAENPVLRQDIVAGGRGTAWLRSPANSGKWTEIARFRGAEGANGAPDFAGVGPGPRPGTAIVSARPEGRDTNGLYVYDTATGEYVDVVFENDDFDVFQVIRDPLTDAVAAACYQGFKYTCIGQTEAFANELAGLSQAIGDNAQFRVVPGGDITNTIMIEVTGPQDLGTYYTYNVPNRELSRLQQARPFNPALLPTSSVYDFEGADGTPLWGYLWLPPGATPETRNLPMIVVPHGGPEARDTFGFDPFATYWASQGYAVIQPNFRGGSGFGRAFVEAGWGQWGGLIQSDVRASAEAVIADGIADPDRMCVAGWSHGGYVAFTASFMDTDLYQCSFAGAGVSDLREMLKWVRQEQGGTTSVSYKYWTNAIGSRSDSSLDESSAAQNIDKIDMPLFIVHGEKDSTVPVEQSEIMISKLSAAEKPFQYMLVPDMDHYFSAHQASEWAEILTDAVDFFQANIGPGWVPPAEE
ncbi:prolyl oligopeptidase family serine peptidase [Henriciella sp. AS95]|uniref:alpha/beta hydrolase family protein n=1 Tax=Henriciella sp. AS95 TaxID=3135782 RepID=UPI003180E06F